MEVRMSELPALVGERVAMRISGHYGHMDVEGEVVTASQSGLVLLSKSEGTMIIGIDEIDELHKTVSPGKIVRRKIRHIPETQARQHLLDRHGVPWDLVRGMTPRNAFRMHEGIDHSNLGHKHRAEGDLTADEEMG